MLGGLRTRVAGDRGLRSTENPSAMRLFSVVISCRGVGVGKAGQSEEFLYLERSTKYHLCLFNLFTSQTYVRKNCLNL